MFLQFFVVSAIRCSAHLFSDDRIFWVVYHKWVQTLLILRTEHTIIKLNRNCFELALSCTYSCGISHLSCWSFKTFVRQEKPPWQTRSFSKYTMGPVVFDSPVVSILFILLSVHACLFKSVFPVTINLLFMYNTWFPQVIDEQHGYKGIEWELVQ